MSVVVRFALRAELVLVGARPCSHRPCQISRRATRETSPRHGSPRFVAIGVHGGDLLAVTLGAARLRGGSGEQGNERNQGSHGPYSDSMWIRIQRRKRTAVDPQVNRGDVITAAGS